MHLSFRFCLAALCCGASLIVWIMANSVAARSQESPPAASGTSGDARQRARALLAKMTVEEKAGQLNQAAGIRLPGVSETGPLRCDSEGAGGSVLWLTGAEEINRLQRIAMEESRLRIPLLVGFDVIHGYRTAFPVPLAMASSWDPSVHERAQRVAAEDARAAGGNWTFAPMVDIARDARWGRIVEGAGEDPHLGSAMAQAQIRGFHGPALGPASLLACVKHFAGYGAAEGGRDYDSVYIPEESTLPLSRMPGRIAVVGPFGDAGPELEGSWTVEGLFGGERKSRPVSIAAGLRHRLGPGASIDVVAFPMPQRAFPSIFEAFSGRKPPPPPTPAALTAAVDGAVAAANRADIVIAALGETAAMSGWDRVRRRRFVFRWVAISCASGVPCPGPGSWNQVCSTSG